jgi:hypothetical protein
MAVARDYHAATLMSTGEVLITGGEDEGSGNSLASAELYDPAAGTFTSTGSMAVAREGHTATLLEDGIVLVAGGTIYNSAGDALASAELYDPAAGTFAATGNMTVERVGHTVTLLGNGTALIAGGYGGASSLASAELYDPAAGTFTATGGMSVAREGHTMTLLANGKVLIAGGYERADRRSPRRSPHELALTPPSSRPLSRRRRTDPSCSCSACHLRRSNGCPIHVPGTPPSRRLLVSPRI